MIWLQKIIQTFLFSHDNTYDYSHALFIPKRGMRGRYVVMFGSFATGDCLKLNSVTNSQFAISVFNGISSISHVINNVAVLHREQSTPQCQQNKRADC